MIKLRRRWVSERPKAAIAIRIADNKRLNPARRPAEVVADGGEHGIDRVAGQACEMIAAYSVFGLGMADDRLDRRPSSHLALDRWGHPPLSAPPTTLSHKGRGIADKYIGIARRVKNDS